MSKSCEVRFGAAYYCEVFNWLGKCHECESKCPVSAHVREGFYWGSETVNEKRTFKELNEKYEKASKAAMSIKDIIKQMELEYARLHDEVVMLVERSAQCLNTLKEIALKPDPLSIPEYIDLLIESEKSEAKPGYLQRVNELLHLKNKAITKGIVARRTMAGMTSERPEPPPRPHRYLPLRKT